MLFRSLQEAKKLGFSDKEIADLKGKQESDIRDLRRRLGIIPTYKQVDTCAGEFEAQTPYFYSCYEEDLEGRCSLQLSY